MTDHRFALVDVFAPRPLTGNPVAVVPDADGLSVEQMRAIAREFNQSETTFVVRPTEPSADWQLRSFTPIGAEVGGAGHDALGAWLWLAAAGRLPEGRDAFVTQIGASLLAVELIRRPGEPTVVEMQQGAPVLGGTADDRGALAAALGLSPADLAAEPAQVISTGAGHLLIPVRDRASVDCVRPDVARLAPVLAAAGGEGAYVYSVGGPRAHAYARFFNPTMGISEDPATGTAAGPLAVRLVRDGVAGGGDTVVVEQGTALGRPSAIAVRVEGDRVTIRASGIIAADGVLHLYPTPVPEGSRMDDIDRVLLSEAIALSAQARAEGNPPFGSLLADVDRGVLARERNTTLTDNDITAHPELKLARLAAAGGHTGTTLYTSCRPCPMCTNVIARSGIARVVFALDTADLDALKPAGYVNPDAGSPAYAGPAFVAEASAVVRGYY